MTQRLPSPRNLAVVALGLVGLVGLPGSAAFGLGVSGESAVFEGPVPRAGAWPAR